MLGGILSTSHESAYLIIANKATRQVIILYPFLLMKKKSDG